MRKKIAILAMIGSLGLLAAGCGAEVTKISDNQWIVHEDNGDYDFRDLRRTCETQNQAVAFVDDLPLNNDTRGSIALITCGDVKVAE